MKTATLERLQPLLNLLRDHHALHEVRLAEFQVRGRGFVHFHEAPEGVVADLLLKKGRIRVSVNSPGEQAELMERIGDILESLEGHTRDVRVRGRARPRPANRASSAKG